MQITLTSGDTVSDVLNRFETKFCSHSAELNSIFDPDFLVGAYLIYDLKAMRDFLGTAFKIEGCDTPKRNSKVSLAGWIAQVLLSAREVADTSEAITEQATDSLTPKIEVLEPEEKPIYTISIIADGAFSEERVNRLPPFLIDRKGRLLKKSWHRSCDAGYSEITSQHLSHIAVDSGLVIKLMTESLEVSQACICGDPPPFIINKGGVFKRDQVKRGLAVSYSQVISEYLANIVVV